MSTCYKCQRELPAGQMECDPPCNGEPTLDEELNDRFAESVQEFMEKSVPIDWDKVTNFEQLKFVMREILDGDDRFLPGSEAFEKLKPFLKDGSDTIERKEDEPRHD